MHQTVRLWTRNYIISIFLMFFIFISYYLTATSVTEYSLHVYAVDQSQAWLASSLFTAGALVARFLSGRYMEIWGRKKTLYLSLSIFLIIMVSYLCVLNWTIFLILRAFHGLAFGICTTVLPAVVMDIIPDSRKGEGNSYFTLSTTIATALGPFLGVFLSTNFENENAMFIVCSVFTIIAFFIAFVLKVPEAALTDAQKEDMHQFKLSNYFEKTAIPISFFILLMGMGYSSIMSYIYSFAAETNLQNAVSYFFLFYALFIVLCRPAAGKLMDRYGENVIMYPCIVIYVIAFVILSYANCDWMVFLSGSLVGIGYGSLISTAQTICVKYAPKHRVALATSAYFISMDTGIVLGPMLISKLLYFTDFRGVYASMAVLVAVSFFLYHFLHGRHHH